MLKNIITLSSLSALLIALSISGCAKSDSAEENADLQPVNAQQAKDANALNGLYYPLFQTLVGLLSDISEDGASTSGLLPPVEFRDGEHNCTVDKPEFGTYTVSRDGYKHMTVTYGDADNTCYDEANGQGLPDKIIGECLKVMAIEGIPSISAVPSGYKVQLEGEVQCEYHKATLSDYTVTATGNTPPNYPNRHSYDIEVSFDFTPLSIAIDGDYHAVKANDNDFTDIRNDEKWDFDDVELILDLTDRSLSADGTASYIGAVREGDTDNNGMELSVGFKELKYTKSADTEDFDVTITGAANASCFPQYVTYQTVNTMHDENSTRDANGSRMPSTGDMSVTVNGYEPVTASFNATAGNAEITLESATEGPTTYGSWRAITTTSGCKDLQEILDRFSDK